MVFELMDNKLAEVISCAKFQTMMFDHNSNAVFCGDQNI